MNVIHRFPHGGSQRPGPARPLSGYGRPVGRPGPRGALRRARPVPFDPRQLLTCRADPLAGIVAVLIELRERSLSS
ncbi:MAG TPA: hypothetical protein VFC99_17910 [Acidimicrobiia bacterium]|nr:hypothetical protein [Acidimicrobiia bacterium]